MSRRLAAVDIGTNSVRLLVADVDGARRRRQARPRSTGACASPVSARASTATARLASRRDRAHARGAARVRRGALDELGVAGVRATATSAARDAANRDELFDRGRACARRRVPSCCQRRRGGARCRSSVPRPTSRDGEPAPYLVVDIGGGSTEFVLGTDAPDGLMSIDIGCVRITEQFLHSDPPAPEELSNAVAVVRDLHRRRRRA